MNIISKKPVHCFFEYNGSNIEYYFRYSPHPVEIKYDGNNTVKISLDNLVENTTIEEIELFLTTLFCHVEKSCISSKVPSNNVIENIVWNIKSVTEATLCSYMYPSIKMIISSEVDIMGIFNLLENFNYPFDIANKHNITKNGNGLKGHVDYTKINQNVLEDFINIIGNISYNDIFGINNPMILIKYLYPYHNYDEHKCEIFNLYNMVRLMKTKEVKDYGAFTIIVKIPSFQKHNYYFILDKERVEFNINNIYNDKELSVTCPCYNRNDFRKIPSFPGKNIYLYYAGKYSHYSIIVDSINVTPYDKNTTNHTSKIEKLSYNSERLFIELPTSLSTERYEDHVTADYSNEDTRPFPHYPDEEFSPRYE